MFNIGFTELLLLGVIALIFIGPKQLPGMARVLGRILSDLQRATQDITSSFLEFRDIGKKEFNSLRDEAASVNLETQNSHSSDLKSKNSIVEKNHES